MQTYFQKMYQYEVWANTEILNKIELLDETDISDKLRAVLSHLINAQEIWLTRIQNETLDVQVWGDIPSNNWQSALEKNQNILLELISQETDFTRLIAYQDSKGNFFETKMEDILQHLLLHSAYHRGQIVQEIKKTGKELPISDYIFYLRR